MDSQPSQKEIEHEALLDRARKYVAEEQAKKQVDIVQEVKASPKSEQKFTTREERMAEVMPRAQEFIKSAKPIEVVAQNPEGVVNTEAVKNAEAFEKVILSYMGNENIASPKVELNENLNSTPVTPNVINKVAETMSNVSDKVTQTVGDVADKAVQYKDEPGALVQDIGNGVGNLLSSFAKGLNNIGDKISSYTEDPNKLGQDVQNGAKKVATKAEETFVTGASMFSLDSLKSGLNKVDSFLQEQQAKNNEVSASRKNNNMP